MKYIKAVTIATTLIFNLTRPGFTQMFLPDSQEDAKNFAFITQGVEPEWVSSVGYLNEFYEGEKLKFYYGGSIKVAPLIILKGAYRLNLSGAVFLPLNDRLKLSFFSNFYIARDKNRAGTMNGLGLELRALPAYYGRKWITGLDLGWQNTFLTHIKHSEEAKDTFNQRYPSAINESLGPNDGWYGSTASRFRFGLSAGRKFEENFLLNLSLGSLLSIQKQGVIMGFSHAQFPVYLETGLLYSW